MIDEKSSQEKRDKFTHEFSGWSVWIEPSPSSPETKAIAQEMKLLADNCGGEKNGLHTFEPHCTLLYNFNSERLLEPKYSCVGNDHDNVSMEWDDRHAEQGGKCINNGENVSGMKVEAGRRLLEKCRRIFKEDQQKIPCSGKLSMDPTAFYFFPYPKEADNGLGFGCVIPLLLLDNDATGTSVSESTSELRRLQRIVCQTFPPDERHNRDAQSGPGEDIPEYVPNDGKFIPHLSLAYAPEVYEQELEKHVEELKIKRKDLLRRLEVKYLSIWNTQGTLANWKLVERIEI